MKFPQFRARQDATTMESSERLSRRSNEAAAETVRISFYWPLTAFAIA